MLHIKGSAAHSRYTCCIDRPPRSADEQLHNNAPHRKYLRKKTTACVSLFVFFTIRRGTFPYNIEDDAITTSQTLTTHYTNTCVKLTIVTHLSFSERIAIANPSYLYYITNYYLHQKLHFFLSFFFHLTYSRWTSSLPSCLWSQRMIFPFLPASRLTFFLSRCKFSTLTTRQLMVEFYLLTFPRFPLRKKEHKSYVD